jgi:hypothetical protein
MLYVVEMLGNLRLRTVGSYQSLAAAQHCAMRHSRHCGIDVEIHNDYGRTVDVVYVRDDQDLP